ncbi:MAG: hypothetical protein IJN16_07720 [Lachnospiraceae bacterium]|nr:hypothetical protein [Lachnospiraceae bacterium]
MKNIMKAQLYQLLRSSILYKTFLCLVVFQIAIFVVARRSVLEMEGRAFSAGNSLADGGYILMCFALIFAIIITGQICGADFVDKTTNYELLMGHLRKDVYVGRALLSMLVGMTGSIILIIIPIGWLCIMDGWGNEMDFGKALLRLLLCLFPIWRIICEFIFLTYIVKNPYPVMIAGTLVSVYSVGIIPMFTTGDIGVLGLGNLSQLMNFTAWRTFALVGEKEITIYDASIAAGDVIRTILLSVVIGGLFLGLGYVFFKKDDLN